jgi:hypothetical protein
MKDCRRIRKAVSQNSPFPAELEQHLFACPPCRRLVRAQQILGLLHEFRQVPVSVSPEFVERVMSGLAGREKEQQTGREKEQQKGWSGPQLMRWAAVLMFSMAVGCGFSVSEDAAESVEWAASLTVVPRPITSIETFGFPNDSLPS